MVSCRRPLCNHHSCNPCAEHNLPSSSSHRRCAFEKKPTTYAGGEGISAKDVALQTESCIRRDFGYPVKYHVGSFPWLLSAERQRTPMDDLDGTTDTGTNASCLASAAMRCLPLSTRHGLAQTLNLHIARSALGQRALDDLCAGATAALPEIARLLTAASAGDAEASSGLEHIFTAPLLARYQNDLGRLREDNVHLNLQVRRINSAQIHQLRTETGPAEAYAAADACRYQQQQQNQQQQEVLDAGIAVSAPKPMSVLRAGLARQKYQYTNVFGASYASTGNHHQQNQQQQPSDSSALSQARSWATGMWNVASGKAPVRVRVDVELNADMRYQLIGRHKTPTEYDRHKDTSKVIVDDDATRNLMLTLESTTATTTAASSSNGDATQQPDFQWRVADIDYLLSSEQRIWQEFKEAAESLDV
ncbi:hypothetical protein EV179_004617 [Coemansia sp. RSA 487]|nr:hypothetical protein EV179_004617 [Coemansia sp. RSA 487]